MAVDPLIECVSKDLAPEYCHSLECCAILTAPAFFVESLPGLSKRCLPRLPLHMHAAKIVPEFLASNI